jgi:hypothetical protein
MPASATAPAIADADSFAASYFTWSRCPIRSAENASRPGRFLKRRSISATSSRQSMPSILKVDSACSSQTVQVLISPSFDTRSSPCEEADDVLIVEGVVDVAASAPRRTRRMPRRRRSW